jgi:ATP-dependent RNA helicase DeaD
LFWFLQELGQQIFRNLEDFAKYLPEVSIAATCGGIIKPQIERLAAPTHRGSNTGSFN